MRSQNDSNYYRFNAIDLSQTNLDCPKLPNRLGIGSSVCHPLPLHTIPFPLFLRSFLCYIHSRHMCLSSCLSSCLWSDCLQPWNSRMIISIDNCYNNLGFPQIFKVSVNTEEEALINKRLPKELLLRIFSYLDVVSLCRCAQVSKVSLSLLN